MPDRNRQDSPGSPPAASLYAVDSGASLPAGVAFAHCSAGFRRLTGAAHTDNHTDNHADNHADNHQKNSRRCHDQCRQPHCYNQRHQRRRYHRPWSPTALFTGILSILLIVLTTGTGRCWSPLEQYENGRRVFLLGHWEDAYQHFQDFLELWHTHELAPQARYYRLLADIRRDHEISKAWRQARIASWSEALAGIRKDLPQIDVVEASAAIDLEQARLGSNSSSSADIFPEHGANISANISWSNFTKQPLAHMQRILSRKWHLDPADAPLVALRAISTWAVTHRSTAPAEMQAHLAFLQAKALWRIFLSPLASSALQPQLEKLECWPLADRLRKLLQQALHAGTPDIRREAALLGISLEAVAVKSRKPAKPSVWLRYLQERGIHHEEALVPK